MFTCEVIASLIKDHYFYLMCSTVFVSHQVFKGKQMKVHKPRDVYLLYC